MANLQIGSYQHKQLFCQLLTDHPIPTHLRCPVLDELTQERVDELQFWSLLHNQIQRSAVVAKSFVQSVKGTLLKEAIAQFAQEKLAIAEAIQPLCHHTPSAGSSQGQMGALLSGDSAFKTLCHQNNMGLLWLSGLYELAMQEDYLQADVLAMFDQLLMIQARHTLFFMNWLAFESQVNQKPEYELVGLLSFWPLKEIWFGTFKKLNRSEYDDNLPIHPQACDYFLGKWGYSDFLQACQSGYESRFVGYDARLVQPRILLKASNAVQTLLGFWPQRTNALKAPSA